MSQPPKRMGQQEQQDSGRRRETDSGSSGHGGFPKRSALLTLNYWRHDTHAAAAVCVFLLLAVGLVFGQTVHHEFIDFDDNKYVYQNQKVAGGFTVGGIAWAFTAGYAHNWHPLTWLTHMLDVQLYGLNPGGHHLTNVLLHAASALLLFGLLWRITGFLWRSAFIAAVFAVHPLRVESVVWVSERKDVLSGLFFMLTLSAYAWYARRPFSLGRYLTVAGLFALGLMSKPMLVTLPFLLLLLDYWPLGRMASSSERGRDATLRQLIIEKVPLLALTIASCAATFFAQREIVVPVDVIPISSRIANALVSYIAYIGKLFYPVGLAIFYPHSRGGLPIWEIVASTLVLVVISAAVVVWRRRFPYGFVGWFWYIGMMVPVIGLVQVGSQSMADRYTYLPQIGLCLSLTWGIAELTASLRYRRRVFGVAFVLLMMVLMGLAWRQASYWKNRDTLWNHALNVTKDNYFAYDAFGNVLAGRGEIGEAVGYYREALKIKPDYAPTYNNLGRALAGLGQIDEAIAHFQKALEIQPFDAEPYYNLGLALKGRGQMDAAIFYYRKALEIRPDYAEAHNNLGIALASIGQIDEAVIHFEKAVEIKPDDGEAHNNFGILLAGCGRLDEAIAHFRKALEISPDNAEVRYNLDLALRQRGQSN
jgi:tetratricopeptide (TPR) repeat protein